MSPGRAVRPGRAHGRVLVLGGTSDIGRALLRALAPTGRVVLAGRDVDALGRVAAADVAPGVPVRVLAFDLTDTAGHEQVVGEAFADGPLDLVVLAAAVLGDQRRATVEPAHAVEVAETDYAGAVSVSLHVARHLRRQGTGTFVVLSSVAALRGRRANYVYGSAKAGLDAFAEGLGADLADDGVRVVTVRPGFVRSAMTRGRAEKPLAVDPDDVARAVVHGLARGRDVVWAPPVMRLVGAGLRLAPRRLLRRVRW